MTDPKDLALREPEFLLYRTRPRMGECIVEYDEDALHQLQDAES